MRVPSRQRSKSLVPTDELLKKFAEDNDQKLQVKIDLLKRNRSSQTLVKTPEFDKAKFFSSSQGDDESDSVSNSSCIEQLSKKLKALKEEKEAKADSRKQIEAEANGQLDTVAAVHADNSDMKGLLNQLRKPLKMPRDKTSSYQQLVALAEQEGASREAKQVLSIVRQWTENYNWNQHPSLMGSLEIYFNEVTQCPGKDNTDSCCRLNCHRKLTRSMQKHGPPTEGWQKSAQLSNKMSKYLADLVGADILFKGRNLQRGFQYMLRVPASCVKNTDISFEL